MGYWIEIIWGTIGGALFVWFLLICAAVGLLAVRIFRMKGWPPFN